MLFNYHTVTGHNPQIYDSHYLFVLDRMGVTNLNPASEIYYGLHTYSFSSADLKCFVRKPIENEELIKCVHQIITAN